METTAKTAAIPSLLSYLSAMEKALNLGDLDYGDDESETNYYCFDQDGLVVEGTIYACGHFVECGDGYWTPRETVLTKAEIEIYLDSASYCDEDGNITEYTKEEVEALDAALQNYISKADL